MYNTPTIGPSSAVKRAASYRLARSRLNLRHRKAYPQLAKPLLSLMESGNTTLPTPSIFTMRFIAASLPGFPGSVFEATYQQGWPFSDLDRTHGSRLVSVLPLLQCVVGFLSVAQRRPSSVIPHRFGRYFAESGQTGPPAHPSEATDSGCSAIQVQVAPCLHDLTLIPLSDMR